jgi:hypothetical protein
MGREDTSERAVLYRCEIRERLARLNGEPIGSALLDHVRVDVDPPRLDAGLAQELEELAAPAAQIEHRRCLAEVVDVDGLPLAHDGPRPTHARLEGEVIRKLRLARTLGRRRRRRRTGRLAAQSPLESNEPLLRLSPGALASLERRRRLRRPFICALYPLERVVDALAQLVERVEDARIEFALLR